MKTYDFYNREERAICAHLFRLLHEQLDESTENPFKIFIKKLTNKKLVFKNGETTLQNLKFSNTSIYCEASIIRDHYVYLKPELSKVYCFMDDLVKLIMKQENVSDCRLYSKLPEILRNIFKTHPKQIKRKAETEKVKLNEGEIKVYEALQGMFNAKPDLVLTVDNVLLVCEAKHTEKFDQKQLLRTWNIAEVWAKLLYKDLGFKKPPVYSVFKLGAAKFNPHISWSEVLEITEQTYKSTDRTSIAIKAGVELLNRPKK